MLQSAHVAGNQRRRREKVKRLKEEENEKERRENERSVLTSTDVNVCKTFAKGRKCGHRIVGIIQL
jgi:hypothetical protein